MTSSTAANVSRQHDTQLQLPSRLASNASPAQPTILRIRRRKRDEHETLDALFIDDERQSSNRPVKRSRQSGALDSYPSSPAGAAPSKGVFRFLETVPTSAFSSEASKRSLRERVTSLLLHPPPRSSSSSNLASARSPRPTTPSRSAPSSNLLLGLGRSSKLSSSSPSSPSSSRVGSLQIQEKARRHARYKIVQEKRSISSLNGKQKRNIHEEFPPTIRSTAKSSENHSVASSVTEEIRILEAAVQSDSDSDGELSKDPIARKLQAFSKTRRRQDVLQPDSWRSSSSSLSRELSLSSAAKDHNSQSREEDDMMSNFVPMLQEYLSLNRPSTPETSTSTPPDGSNDVSPPHPGFSAVPDLSSGDAADSDSEWVYDVYYRDVGNTAAIPTSNDGIDIGGVSGFERIAALTGLNEDEVLLGEGAGEDDSDAPNTDDEDSNEEDFYRNDYPEGDEDASDDADSNMSESDGDSD